MPNSPCIASCEPFDTQPTQPYKKNETTPQRGLEEHFKISTKNGQMCRTINFKSDIKEQPTINE